jgi:hypothetical protein
MNGVAVLVATDEQPVIVVPPRVKVTDPATLVVATMVAGLFAVDPGNSPLPPLNTTVGVVVAAEADPTLKKMTLPMARDPTAINDMSFFMMNLSCWWVGGVTS